jgi:hypothetical protein
MQLRATSESAPRPSGEPAAEIEQARCIARERGGTLISDRVPNVHTPLVWTCGSGHKWTARLSKVKGGTWCAICAGNGPVTIQDMRRLASEWGGRCLSEKYVNNHTPLRWICSKGHEWSARPADIRRSWCPACSRSRKLELSDLRKIARSRGGELLSKRYVNRTDPLIWRCGNRHVWQTVAAYVKAGEFRSGTWCPQCPRQFKGRPARLSIEEMRQIARDRGGECLSTTYVNCVTKLKWRCAEGHEWRANPGLSEVWHLVSYLPGQAEADIRIVAQNCS